MSWVQIPPGMSTAILQRWCPSLTTAFGLIQIKKKKFVLKLGNHWRRGWQDSWLVSVSRGWPWAWLGRIVLDQVVIVSVLFVLQVETLQKRLEHTAEELVQMHQNNIDLMSQLRTVYNEKDIGNVAPDTNLSAPQVRRVSSHIHACNIDMHMCITRMRADENAYRYIHNRTHIYTHACIQICMYTYTRARAYKLLT